MPEDISLLAIAHWSPLHLLIPLVIIQRIAELRVARRNEKVMRERGAVEYGQSHYAAIVALHAVWFVGMIGEVVILTRPINPFWPALLLVVLLAQGLRYWAIRSLGTQWNTKILVLPKAKAVAKGPYRYIKHPNYVAVVIELLLFPMIFSAYLTAITASLINLYLLRIRIRDEEHALREVGKGYEKVGSNAKVKRQNSKE